MPPVDPPPIFAGTFNFLVTLTRVAGDANAPTQLGDGGFQECTGLELEMDVQELPQGGRNDSVGRLVGRGKYTNIVLRRGMLYPRGAAVRSELWDWIQAVLSGVRPVRRYGGRIDVYDARGCAGGAVVATWTFDRGLPAKVSGPQLNARTGEIAIEELTIAHEGLRLSVGGT